MCLDLVSYLLGKKKGGGATPTLQTKSVTITENGTSKVNADSGYDGLQEVNITTNVSGGSSAETLDDCTNYLNNYLNSLFSVVEDYNILENEPVILYTPNSDYRSYVIGKTMTGSYRIGWVKTNEILCTDVSTTGAVRKNNITYSNSRLIYVPGTINWYRSTSVYSSLSEAINALKNSSTEYSLETFDIQAYGNAPYYLTATNTILVRASSQLTDQSQRISNDENIVVIS